MANFLKSLFVKGVEIDTDGAALGKALTYNGTKFAPADVTVSGAYVSTVNGASGAITNIAVTTGKLSQFASTSSSELAGVVSDETGSGALVFGTSPAITTSLTTPSTTFSLVNTTATTVNFAGAATTLNIGTANGNTNVAGYLFSKTLNVSSAQVNILNNDSSSPNDGLFFFTSDANSIYTQLKASTVTTSKTITLPNLSGTLSTLDGSQAFTNKTYNGLTISTTTGTLTIANGKTLTASNTLTFTGTDSSSVAFGTGGTVAYTASPTLTNVTINSSSSGQPLTVGAVDGTNEGGDIKLNGAGAYASVYVDNYQGTLRGIVNTTARWVATSTGVDVTGTFSSSGNTTLNGNINVVAANENPQTGFGQASSGGAVQNGGTRFINDSTGSAGFVVRYQNRLLGLNRQGNDGALIDFAQDGTIEGTISVAGTTITYGAFSGSHWSQLQDKNVIEIPRGTIMETIDEMCEWGLEDNDQLAKVKISDTQASKAVYGVFMYWHTDDEDYPYDMTVTSLGAYIVRIKAGETVQIGDLIESAGNGCGQVQQDDVIKSSTVGKITATQVVETYEDGSYTVPCVLYCG